MDKLLCPSMMCANFDNLKDEVIDLDEAGANVFHIDIMDGIFVPNFGMGIQDIEAIRKNTNKIIDVHLMTVEPEKHINLFTELGADIIHVHPEAGYHTARTIDLIHSKGKKAGIAINPGTSVENIMPLLSITDYVTVMTVNPGFAGQKYLSYVYTKINQLLQLKEDFKFDIIVDGAISPEVISDLSNKGVKGFVLGTSSLFNKEKPYKEILDSLKTL